MGEIEALAFSALFNLTEQGGKNFLSILSIILFWQHFLCSR
jgi:hypothetical protein